MFVVIDNLTKEVKEIGYPIEYYPNSEHIKSFSDINPKYTVDKFTLIKWNDKDPKTLQVLQPNKKHTVTLDSEGKLIEIKSEDIEKPLNKSNAETP